MRRTKERFARHSRDSPLTPEIARIGGFYHLAWPEWKVNVDASRVYSHSEGPTTAELHFQSMNGPQAIHLARPRVNLLAPRSLKQLADMLTERLEGPPWEEIMEQVAYHVLRLHREGEPAHEINTLEKVQEPPFLVWPLLREKRPVITFGAGGSLKSYTALVLAITAMLPWTENPLGLKPQVKPTLPLYLDWESEESEVTWRAQCIMRGMDLGHLPLWYRRCYQPLALDVEEVQRLVVTHNIGLVIVDSLGLACGGDLNAPAPTMAFFAAVRALGVTSLIVAHETKDETKRRTPFGSVYFFNLARSVWWAKNTQEEGADRATILLKHTKANQGRLERTLAFEFHFGPDWTKVKAVDPRGLATYVGGLSLPKRIPAMLLTGAMHITDIVEETGASENTVSKTLSILNKQGIVIKLGEGRWGAAADEG